MRPESRRILLEAAVIFLLGVVIGLSFNHRLVIDAFTGIHAPTPDTEVGETAALFPQPVDLLSMRKLLGEGAVAVDARARELYQEGHLPGAMSLPLAEVEAELASFRKRVPLGSTVVIYCSGYGCPDSFDLATRLLAEGFRDMRVFEGGYPEWRDAGLPVEGGGP